MPVGDFSIDSPSLQLEGSAAVSPGCILCLVPADHPPRRCRAETDLDHLDPGTCASSKGLTGMVNFVVGLVVVGTLTPKIGGTLSPAEQKWHLQRLLSDGDMTARPEYLSISNV